MQRCQECGSWVVFDYFDENGSHWHCPSCGAKDSDYSTVATDYTEIDKNAKVIYSTNTNVG